MKHKLSTLFALAMIVAGLSPAMAEQVVLQSSTAQNLAFGPVTLTSDHNTAITGLAAPAPAIITATGGSTTTITSATNAVAGQTVRFAAGTTTATLQNQSYVITSVSGSGPYTYTMPTMAGTPVSTDTYTVYNSAGAGATTTSIASQVSAAVGQWVQFTAFSTTSGLRGTGAWVTAISGSGPYTLTLSPALGSAPASTDTFTLSNLAVTVSKNAGSYGVPSGTLAETGNGYYYLAGNATDDNTLGRLMIHWAVLGATAGDSNESPIFVAAYDPLSPFTTTISTINTTTAGTNTRVTTALPSAAPASNGGLITVGTGAGQLSPNGSGALPGATTALSGTATAGGASTITLASGSATTDLYKGDTVYISSGTGAGQMRTITGWNGGTLTATVAWPWTTAPDNTSVYAVTGNAHPGVNSSLQIATSNLPADYLSSGEQTSLTSAAAANAKLGTPAGASVSADIASLVAALTALANKIFGQTN